MTAPEPATKKPQHIFLSFSLYCQTQATQTILPVHPECHPSRHVHISKKNAAAQQQQITSYSEFVTWRIACKIALGNFSFAATNCVQRSFMQTSQSLSKLSTKSRVAVLITRSICIVVLHTPKKKEGKQTKGISERRHLHAHIRHGKPTLYTVHNIRIK